jgi:hypothetical protein
METGRSNPRTEKTPKGSGRVAVNRIPLEWMDAGVWRLPSGKALAEFALQAGFLAPLLLGTPRWMRGGVKRSGSVSSLERASDGRNSSGR